MDMPRCQFSCPCESTKERGFSYSIGPEDGEPFAGIQRKGQVGPERLDTRFAEFDDGPGRAVSVPCGTVGGARIIHAVVLLLAGIVKPLDGFREKVQIMGVFFRCFVDIHNGNSSILGS